MNETLEIKFAAAVVSEADLHRLWAAARAAALPGQRVRLIVDLAPAEATAS